MTDLLEAHAAVNWTVANVPALQERLDSWVADNVSVAFQKAQPNTAHDLLIATEKEMLPLAFNVEVGAYINVIRSALDILAVALAKRHGITDVNEIYFPVVGSEAIFLAGKFKGAKLVTVMPQTERVKLESLKPYKGGNDPLWTLHRLDILRKHHRLLTVNARPGRLLLTADFNMSYITPNGPPAGYTIAKNETVLAMFPKGAQKPKVNYTPAVFLAETDPLIRGPATDILMGLADIVHKVINLFDC